MTTRFRKVGALVLLVAVATGAAAQQAKDKKTGSGAQPTAVTGVTVAMGTAGPVVTWQPVSGATYAVARWKLDDPACCNNASNAAQPLTITSWQDAPLPVSGTFVYQVTATVKGKTLTGQAQFAYQKPITATMVLHEVPTTTTGTAVIPTKCSLRTGPGPVPADPVVKRSWLYGAELNWAASGVPEVSYVLERAVDDNTFQWQPVASSCDGGVFTSVNPNVGLDRTGAIQGRTYVYRLTMVKPDGTSGWKTVRWTAPFLGTIMPPGKQVTGSSVTIYRGTYACKDLAGNDVAYCSLSGSGAPQFGVATSYGAVKEQDFSLNSMRIDGVPVGKHTFTLYAKWPSSNNFQVQLATLTVPVAP